MIDLEARRKANLARLNGTDPKSGKVVIPFTATSVINNPEEAWECLRLCIARKTETRTSAKGKEYTRTTNELAHPELIEEIPVGVRAVTSANAKHDKTGRTNIETIKEMYEIRNRMNRYYENDIDDDFVDYFKSVIEILDGYAIEVVSLMQEDDAEFLNKVNAIRGC